MANIKKTCCKLKWGSFLIATALVSGCSKPNSEAVKLTRPEPGESQTASRITVQGEVFIKTRSSENVRLGLVEVRAIPAPEFDVIAKELCSSVKAATQELLDKEILITAKLALCQNKIAELAQASTRLKNSQDRFSAEMTKHDDDTNAVFAAAVSSRMSRRARIDDYTRRLQSGMDDSNAALQSITQQEILAVPAEINTKLRDLLESGPVSRTDSRGRFSINLSLWTPQVLIAMDHRLVGKETEHYAWAVEVDPRSLSPDNIILLSNHNLSDTAENSNRLHVVYEVHESVNHLSAAGENAVRDLPDLPTIPEQEPRKASNGTAYLLGYTSIRTAHGMSGFPPGTNVQVVANVGRAKQIKVGDQTAVVDQAMLTDDQDRAEIVMLTDQAQQNELQSNAQEVYEAEQLRKLREEVRRANDVKSIQHAEKERF